MACPNDGQPLLPQWSPLVTSGTRFAEAMGAPPRPRAAMEPARDERDQLAEAFEVPKSRIEPQWSPLVTSGTSSWYTCGRTAAATFAPQWSPLVTSGTSSAVPYFWFSADTPQWSPLVTSGTSLRGLAGAGAACAAAMEPARDERDQGSSFACPVSWGYVGLCEQFRWVMAKPYLYGFIKYRTGCLTWKRALPGFDGTAGPLAASRFRA